MTDHPRLTRYTPYVNGAAFMGMLRQNAMHPETFGPDFDWTHGPYVLASEADAEIDRLRAENADLTAAVESLQNRWAARPISHPDGEALASENDRQRAEVERLTRERDEARKPPHCINCHCEESAKGMVDLSDYLDLHRGLMAVVYESKSHAEAVLFSERALRHAESEHVISEAASSAVASDPYADQNRALVAEIAARRGITLGHLREDGGCELAQIMRRLDAAEAEVERLRGAPHCPTCGCGG